MLKEDRRNQNILQPEISKYFKFVYNVGDKISNSQIKSDLTEQYKIYSINRKPTTKDFFLYVEGKPYRTKLERGVEIIKFK